MLLQAQASPIELTSTAASSILGTGLALENKPHLPCPDAAFPLLELVDGQALLLLPVEALVVSCL